MPPKPDVIITQLTQPSLLFYRTSAIIPLSRLGEENARERGSQVCSREQTAKDGLATIHQAVKPQSQRHSNKPDPPPTGAHESPTVSM